MKNVKLTMAQARAIVWNQFPKMKLEMDKTPTAVAIYRGTTGPDGLDVKIENDWFHGDGYIHMVISDRCGMGHIHMLYDQNGKRCVEAEEEMRREDDKRERAEWVQSVGVELAHRLVDQYGGMKL